ncbi:MAG TPA: type II secretion system F family protein [Gemmataceae bacterium]|nr:type II secretion system F family protein [Gemmataceae bacterium]
MPVFSYVGRDAAGRPQRGTQEAPTAAAVVSSLRQRGWLVLDVRSQSSGGSARGKAFLLLQPRSLSIEISFLQLAVMLRSGLTLLAALKTLAEQNTSRSMAYVWDDVATRIQQGSSLGDAMAAHRCFGHIVVQLIRVGEQTGTLEQVIGRAADTLERRRLLFTQIATALTYPAIVLAAAIAVTAYMVVGLIPKLRVFLNALGRRLPPMTQSLLDISEFATTYGAQIGIGLLVLTVALIALYLWPPSRMIIDRMLLRVPLVGSSILRTAATVQFAHGLGVMLESGITLVEGLRTVQGMHRNRYVAAHVAKTREAVLKGSGLAEPLADGNVFMPMLPRMVAVGEAAGTLDDVLAEVAKFHELQLQITIRRFSTLIEPAIVVVVGTIVGYVYIAFFMAMFAAAGPGGR